MLHGFCAIMLFHLTIFFFTALFFLGLEFTAAHPILQSWSWYFFSISPLLILSLVAAKRLTHNLKDSFLPSLLAFSSPTLLSLVSSPSRKHWFIVLSSLMYYFALLAIYRLRGSPSDKTGSAFLQSAGVAGLFFVYAAAYGFYLNFSVPLWELTAVSFAATTLASYQMFRGGMKRGRKEIFSYSLFLGAFLGEVTWALNFWPFGYLTIGSATVIIFYLFWDLTNDIVEHRFSLRKLWWQAGILLVLLVLLIASSPWRIVV